jgi:large subunit ribosomal protein L4
MKAAALRGALSDRAAHGRVHVVSSFTDGDQPRTKDALSVLSAACGVAPSAAPVLVVADADDVATWKSLRNVHGVHLIASGQLNTYDVLVSDHVVFTESALAAFIARTGGGPAAEAEPIAAEAEPVAAEDAGTEPAEAEETEAEETEATEPEDAES